MKRIWLTFITILVVFACAKGEATQGIRYDTSMFFECSGDSDIGIEDIVRSFANRNSLHNNGGLLLSPWELVMTDQNTMIHFAKIIAAPGTYVVSIVSRPSTRRRDDMAGEIRSDLLNINGCRLYLEKQSQNDVSKDRLFDEFLRYYRSLR